MNTREVQLPMDVDLLPAIAVHAGNLHAMYESGCLRYIGMGNTELVRKIYCALRNITWHTLTPIITNEEMSASGDAFRISYQAYYGTDPLLFKTNVTIEGDASNRIVFDLKGEVVTEFSKSRIGLCLHHPINECMGRMVSVTRPDGSSYQARFPDRISPFQPLLDVRKQQWITEDGLQVDLLYEGDTFETEDQRNWSDSSFKTYSTPLEIPFPVLVKPGDRFDQRITLQVSIVTESGKAQTVDNRIVEEKLPFPKIGFSRSDRQEALPDELVARFKQIPFDLYRVSIRLNETGWERALRVAVGEAEKMVTRLHLSVKFSENFIKEEAEFATALQGAIQLVDSILVIHTEHPVSPTSLLHYIYPRLKKDFAGVEVGYGTELYFANINRQPPEDTSFDFISFHVQPQVHAFDSRTMLENLERQSDLLASGDFIATGKPVAISPLTLNDGTAPDERQFTSFAAHWMLMTLQTLAHARHLIYFELTGRSGLIAVEDDGSLNLSQVYQILLQIRAFDPVSIITRKIQGKILLDGLLLENRAGDRLMIRSPERYVHFKNESNIL